MQHMLKYYLIKTSVGLNSKLYKKRDITFWKGFKRRKIPKINTDDTVS